jgi:predicted HicB family RNase H-like nuclease
MPKISTPKKSQRSAVSSRSVVQLARLEKPQTADLTPMNFRVPEAFHREFKLYAVQNGMSMVDLLQEAFVHFRDRRGR